MLVLTRDAYDTIIRHAITGTPEEVCGILGGEYSAESSRVERVAQATNVADIPEREYLIDPEEQLRLMEEIEADGLEVAGFYHSHPAGPPQPSVTDADRATWPDLSYVIVILNGEYPYVGSWRWNKTSEQFTQETVQIR